jgi:WD40 repeat protein
MLVLDGEHPVAQLAFTPDGTRLVVARAEWYPPKLWPAEVWTLAGGECLPLGTPELKSYPAVAVHPSGQLAFFAYGHLISTYGASHPLAVVSLKDGTGRQLGGSLAESVIASPDGNWVVTSGGDPRAFVGYRCNPKAKTVLTEGWRAEEHVTSERLGGFLEGGSQFVTIGSYRIVVRDTATGEVRNAVRYPADGVVRPVVSLDGKLLAAHASTRFYVWDTATWEKRLQLRTEDRKSRLACYALHPTRPIFAAIQAGQTLVKFFDLATGKPLRKFNWKLGEMRAVAFSADGTLAAAGGAKGKVVVWDVDE